MAISSEDLTRLGKSSLDLYLRNEPVDQIAQERPLLEMLLKGKKPFGGAKQNVVEQIRKDYGSNFAWAYGEAKVNFQKRDTLEQAQFPWRRCVDSVYISYDELFSNGINVREGEKGAYRLETSEKVQLTNLLNETNHVLLEGFLKSLDKEMHRDGTASADALVGLDALIALDPTKGTLGGIDRAKAAYWRNYADKTLAAADMLGKMEKAWRSCFMHGGSPDYILAGADFIDAYAKAVPVTRNADSGRPVKLDGGIGEGTRTGLFFKGKEIVWDPTFEDLDAAAGSAVSGTPRWSKRCYFMNSKHITWRDDGYDIVTPVRPHDTLCLYMMVNMRAAISINRPNSCAVLALA